MWWDDPEDSDTRDPPQGTSTGDGGRRSLPLPLPQPNQRRERRRIREEVFRLADLFFSRKYEAVHGIGSTINEGQRVPLVIADPVFDTRPTAPRRAEDILRDIGRAFGALPSRLPTDQRASLQIPFADADAKLRESLRDWRIPEDARILFSPPAMPLAFSSGMSILSQERNATLGFLLKIGDRRAFTTAGHLIRSAPSTICFKSRKRFWHPWQTTDLGIATFFNDPQTGTAKPGDGIDVAIVDLPPSERMHGIEAELAEPTSVRELEAVVIAGGQSGLRRAWVNGPLVGVRCLDGRTWENVWNLCETDRGVAQRGDSGGPVTIRTTGQPLGHIIAALGSIRPNGLFSCAIAQDITTIVQFLQVRYAQPVTLINDELSGLRR